MKKLLILSVLVACICMSGCSMTETTGERFQRYGNIVDIQSRQMTEDWDYFWLMDRPSNLSPWHVRTGLPN